MIQIEPKGASMAVMRQPQPDRDPPERPALRLVATSADTVIGAIPETSLDRDAFTTGLRWGIVLSTLGFWLPVAAALYVWLR